MNIPLHKLWQKWKGIRRTSGFRNLLLYLVFVVIASVFWLVMSLNDSVTRTVDVKLMITGVPDSVKFITDPPEEFHITVRDKITQLLRNGMMRKPTVILNYREYASKGVFRVTQAEIAGVLKNTFGNSAIISASSLDSLNLKYAVGKGKRVPVVVSVDISASPGYIISEAPMPDVRSVTLYSTGDILDTIMRVTTKKIKRRNLSSTVEVESGFVNIPGVRIVPPKIKVKIPVEPLVRKESMAAVVADHLPEGKGMILFPPKVPVVYYVPMGMFSSEDVPFDVHVDYLDVFENKSNRVKVRLGDIPDYIENVEIRTDSVEYSLIANF